MFFSVEASFNLMSDRQVFGTRNPTLMEIGTTATKTFGTTAECMTWCYQI